MVALAVVVDRLAPVDSVLELVELALVPVPELELEPELELAFSLMSDIAVERTFAVVECKSVAVEYNWDFQRLFEVHV